MARMGQFGQPGGPYGGMVPTVHPTDNILVPNATQTAANATQLQLAQQLGNLASAQEAARIAPPPIVAVPPPYVPPTPVQTVPPLVVPPIAPTTVGSGQWYVDMYGNRVEVQFTAEQAEYQERLDRLRRQRLLG